MTTDLILWAIFVLLSLALVLQVITARRGPWERPTVGHYDGERVGYVDVEEAPVGLLATGVDPLWGKGQRLLTDCGGGICTNVGSKCDACIDEAKPITEEVWERVSQMSTKGLPCIQTYAGGDPFVGKLIGRYGADPLWDKHGPRYEVGVDPAGGMEDDRIVVVEKSPVQGLYTTINLDPEVTRQMTEGWAKVFPPGPKCSAYGPRHRDQPLGSRCQCGNETRWS